MRPLTIMLATVALVAVPVWLACYTIAAKLPALRAARAALGG